MGRFGLAHGMRDMTWPRGDLQDLPANVCLRIS